MFQSDKPDSKMSNKTSSILGPELEIHGDVKVSEVFLFMVKYLGISSQMEPSRLQMDLR